MIDKITGLPVLPVEVTQADEKRAKDWAFMLGRMGGVVLDASQIRGLSAQFAAHRLTALSDIANEDEPVALLHFHAADNEREVELYNYGAGRLTDADKAAGWTETPLYASPLANDTGALREALEAIRQIDPEELWGIPDRCTGDRPSFQTLDADEVFRIIDAALSPDDGEGK